jgi:hypothetical protein
VEYTKSMKKAKSGGPAPDLSATVGQSAVDKLVGSVTYPLPVFDHTWPFQGLEAVGTAIGETDSIYTADGVAALLKSALQVTGVIDVSSVPSQTQDQLAHEVLRGTSELIESAKRCLAAKNEADSTGQVFNGPDPTLLNKILAGGIAVLAEIQGIKFQAHLEWLKVAIDDQPSILLNSPRVSVNALHIRASATGELWCYHPTFHCSSLCFNWSTTWGWDRIASLTVRDVRIDADAHVDLSTRQATVVAQGVFDKLRLDFPILDQIPLETPANKLLADDLVVVYDASKYVEVVPVLGSKFSVDAVQIPPAVGELIVEIEIKQI